MMRVEINSLGEIISRGDKYLVHCYRDLFLFFLQCLLVSNSIMIMITIDTGEESELGISIDICLLGLSPRCEEYVLTYVT